MTTIGKDICRALVEYRHSFNVNQEQLAARMGLHWTVFKHELDILQAEFQVFSADEVRDKWINMFGELDEQTAIKLRRQR